MSTNTLDEKHTKPQPWHVEAGRDIGQLYWDAVADDDMPEDIEIVRLLADRDPNVEDRARMEWLEVHVPNGDFSRILAKVGYVHESVRAAIDAARRETP